MLSLLLEIIGTIAFSVSGAFVGIKKKMDIFGVVCLGLITATGGGVIRDIIIDIIPPKAFQNPWYAIIAIVTAILVFIPRIRKKINLNTYAWVIVDAIGLASFTIVGVVQGTPYNNFFLEVFLGAITGVGGGVIRDVCAQEMPSIFVKNFYACASIIGAIICALLYGISSELAIILGFITIVVLRIMAFKYEWHLPKA